MKTLTPPSETPATLETSEMPRKKPRKKVPAPPLDADPLHARLVGVVGSVHDDAILGALADALGCHRAALFVKRLIYWLSRSNTAPERPRAAVYRQSKKDEDDERYGPGFGPDDLSTYGYWVCRSRQEWSVMGLDRWKLEKVYAVCGDLVERGYFLFAAQRRTHYRLDYAKLLDIFERDERVQFALASPALSRGRNRRPVGGESDDENESKQLRESYMQMKEGRKATSDRSEVSPRSEKRRISEEDEEEIVPPPARRPINTLPETKSSNKPSTGFAGACACTPSAPSGAAAPEPPPPARKSALDSVEAAPAKPEVTSFQQAQAILQAAKGATTKDKLRRLVPYGKRTRLVVGYLLIWQGECEAHKRDDKLSEAHFLQSGELADNEGVELGKFYGTLREAWKTIPQEGYDPCFMSSRHSKKFTLFCKHFRRMEDELIQEGKL